MNRYALPISTAAYAAAVLSANVLTARYGMVPAGFGLEVLAGTYAAGFALLARDYVHRFGGVGYALVAVVVGAGLSALLSTPALAVASGLAFLTAEIVDLLVFAPLRRRRGFVEASLASNVASAPVDTFAFLLIAGFPVTAPVVIGQVVAKLIHATLIPLLVWSLVTGERGRGTVTA